MRTGAVSCGHRKVRRTLAERSGLAVKKSSVRVEPVRKCRREARIEQRAFRKDHFEEIVETFVEKYRRIKGHDHIDAEENFAEPFMNVKINRAFGLRICPGPIKHRHLGPPKNRKFHFKRAVAETVVVNVVGKCDGLFWKCIFRSKLSWHRGCGPTAGRTPPCRSRGQTVAKFAHAQSRPSDTRQSRPLGRRDLCRACAYY